ncbi:MULTISPECIES: dihydroorotate dehydrogenase [Leuconostoc]|uniref:Dihydroorotate dehydrogenase n=2 Tax=Leuconostoc kimchii TaxID=136609 RepID=D5T0J3_LEUKI|nr:MULTISPECIES: dihydroorotate dehydrogenase [Leuconostoc]ADG39792.1 dihydroorotate dehydrogenase, catalytic subunit (dihydroorotateoxidase) [Leuconostoc kimchii IMSNU 11154]AEJ30349.1 dihydroorotate dehydrogenase, catalytic subunit (dihydroorotateoxidase) [Leuconostoc sp. C2]QBR47417.1 dihydroorotate dehydrogenase [Leuconostoc kimchii]
MTIKNRLSVELPGLNMKNPIMNSSGAVYFGLDEGYDIEKTGTLVTKTVTWAERSGNPQPWTVELPSGLLNSVGLANPGIHNVLKDFLPAIKAKYGNALPVMVSIAGETVDEYVALAQLLTNTAYLTAIEVNLSCPNVDRGGMAFGVSAEAASEVITSVKKVTNLPIYAKLSPNVTDIRPIAKAVEVAGASGIVLINTVTGMSFDLQKRQPKLARGTGGLSGKAVHPIAVRLVYEAAQTVSIPIIGVGGIEAVDDALEFMMAGASAVQVGAALAYNTHVMSDIIKALPGALDNYHFGTVQEVTRTLK